MQNQTPPPAPQVWQLQLHLAELELKEAESRLGKWERYHSYHVGKHLSLAHALEHTPTALGLVASLSLAALALLPLTLPLARELGIRHATRLAAQYKRGKS